MAEVYGGDRLAARLKEIGDRLGKGGSVKVGFLSGAKYPDGTSVAMVAAIQDFGAPSVGIPPRPFFRNMVAKESRGWPDAIVTDLARTDYDVDRTLGRLGVLIEGQLRQSIVDTNLPPLKPATIRRKGFSKPLIDTSNMINSISSKVEK